MTSAAGPVRVIQRALRRAGVLRSVPHGPGAAGLPIRARPAAAL